MLPFFHGHALPEVRPNDSRRHRIHTYRREFQGERACQSLDCSADTRGNNPSFMRPLPDNSSSEHDGAALANILASVFDRSQCGPIAQVKGASGLSKICVGKAPQMEAIASGENQVIDSTQ